MSVQRRLFRWRNERELLDLMEREAARQRAQERAARAALRPRTGQVAAAPIAAPLSIDSRPRRRA